MSLGKLIAKAAVKAAVKGSRKATRAGKRVDVDVPSGRAGAGRSDGPAFKGDASDFYKLSRRLKAEGGNVRKDALKELQQATKPLIAQTRAEALRTLPSRNGLAKRVAKTPQRVSVRTGISTAGVRVIVANNKRGGAAGADRGVVRHPTYGRRPWVAQRVPEGWFTGTMRRESPAVKKELERMIEDQLNRIARKPL